MAGASNMWLWVAGGAALVLLMRRSADAADAPSAPSAPPPRSSGNGNARLIGVTPLSPSGSTGSTSSRPAPSSAFAQPCVFVTSSSHGLYFSPDESVPSTFLLAGTQVTVIDKRVVGGTTWFAIRLHGESVPPLSSDVTGHAYWFTPTADERSRCT